MPRPGPRGTTDDRIPAWLSNGEYIVKASMARLYRPLLDRINSGLLSAPRFAQGGPVSTTYHQEKSVSIHNHGELARLNADPRMLTWQLRKL